MSAHHDPALTITLKSWHGRTTIPGHHGTRNSLLNIWYDRVFDENRELAEECADGSAARAA